MTSPFEELARDSLLPDDTPVRVLPHRACRSAAHLAGLSLRQAEIEALRAGIVPERYLRNFKTLDCEAQAKLLESKVALAGLGGLGGPVLEGLCRLGFGRIDAADPDLFEPTNLNRQLLATEATLGASKVGAAVARAREINPAVELRARQVRLAPEDFARFFQGADVAIDALGGMACRPAAERGAARAGVPLVTGSVAGSTATAATVLPGWTGPAGLMCPSGTSSGPGAEDVLGCLAPAIQVAAGLMLAEAVRLALGRPPRLGGPTGRMAVLDLDDLSLERFALPGPPGHE
ncbi:putative adenylyltransferase/sulfurtransferase MoeZ [Fundidesulfovibrio magnetotacticus]|uniref:Putative adenylyltransferase/sulfurtransferase MoeZ n=1 Tax=Fundidesulfovibrio magnetotacticus TaxID=2730080 RepID=A0A6V8LP70_9BACT|nr:ThiF family adenylyltransferase [Fundidesulfovibrio magnetotacticus]GFK94363.1 putative adenylyltransferase/sulfurtransferase MoeZ [Fundidesulfovibrio magnetotacticus]